MLKQCLLFACAAIFFYNLSAQAAKHRVISVPVQKNGVLMRDPWVGGVNAPQFSGCDLNQDGIKDLFVFDREGNKVITYLGNGHGSDSMFDYAPQYESLFPSGLTLWTLIRDYNKDGIPDIFSYSDGAIQVFKGSIQSGILHFDLVCPKISYINGGFNPHIFTNYTDIPVLADINRDGDLDILSYDVFGSAVGYYENQTKEHPGDPHYDIDSFRYLQVTACWGNFSMALANNSINLNVSCKGGGAETQNANGNQRHSGNTIYGFDADNDHDIDLLNGNIGYNNLLFLKNCGDSSYANVCLLDSVYPVCNVPFIMPTYPAAYGVDLNNHPYDDLLIAPNQTTAALDVKNVFYYKNTNDTSCPFEFQSDSFLIHHMLDFGTESKALFYDFNGDGLPDIIVGNYGYFQTSAAYRSTLAYYQNTGTASHPQFTEVTMDYNNFSNYGWQGVNPAFGDMDGDGHNDLIVGDISGNLHYFRNMAATGSSFPALTTAQYFGLNAGPFAAPFIYDVNGDSLPDLVVGRQDGKLSYYWNFGTKTNPQFSVDSVNASFGNVTVVAPLAVDGFSQPFIVKDPLGNMKLFVGSRLGNIYEYDIDAAQLRSGTFNRITTDFLQMPVGFKSTLSIADINNDGDLEYLVGNSRGGLMLFSDSLWDPAAAPLSIEALNEQQYRLHIYPNPAKDYFVCTLSGKDFINPKTELYNLLGEKVNAEATSTGNRIVINTSQLSAGLYIVRITEKDGNYCGKVLLK